MQITKDSEKGIDDKGNTNGQKNVKSQLDLTQRKRYVWLVSPVILAFIKANVTDNNFDGKYMKLLRVTSYKLSGIGRT